MSTYKTWLEQDVVWIITDEERAAFNLLNNDAERDVFVEAFWQRRNPQPDSFENPFKGEHYRRIVYANEHFGGSFPGWKSDRGHIYILYGAPDRIESFPDGRPRDLAPDEPQEVSTYPVEAWSYRYLEGVGQDVVIDFVDVCQCGQYRLKIERSEEDALLHIHEPSSPHVPSPEEARTFMTIGSSPSPTTQFSDLRDILVTRIDPKTLKFDVRIESVKATDITSLVPVTIAVSTHDVTFVEKNGIRTATLDILGQLRTLTGHTAEIFEDTVEIEDSASKPADDPILRRKELALRKTRYRLEIAVKDVNGDRKGTWIATIHVGD